MERIKNQGSGQTGHGMSREGDRRGLPGYVRIIRYAVAVLSSLFGLFVVVQIFFAGLAIFVDASNWSLHSSFVQSFSFLPIVLILLAFLGRLPWAICWQSIGLFVMIAVQYMTVHMGSELSYLSALHPVVALGLFWTSYAMAKQSWKLVKKSVNG